MISNKKSKNIQDKKKKKQYKLKYYYRCNHDLTAKIRIIFTVMHKANN